MNRTVAATSLFLLSALPFEAALAKCPGESQTEMNQCAGEAAERATQTMKATYNKVWTPRKTSPFLAAAGTLLIVAWCLDHPHEQA